MDRKTKISSRKQTLDIFRRIAYTSSPEASELTGMSRSTTHRALEFLRGKNLLVVAGKGQSTDSGGKKPVLLGLNRTYRHILCFHIMVDGLAAGITDLKGRLLAENSLLFKPNSPLEKILSHMRASYESMASSLRLREKDFAGVAVAANGVVDVERGVLASSTNFSSWGRDIPLKQLLAKMFKTQPPIYIDNANRFGAYAEYRTGQAVGVENFMVLDSHYDGLGAGVVLKGEVWRGKRFLAGEIGHLTVDPEGRRICSCGARGCLEAMTSMAYLEECAKEGYVRNKKSVLFTNSSASEVTYKAIYRAANGGDEFARRLVAEQAQWLAVGVNGVALMLDPDLVVLQGSLAHGGEFLLQALNEKASALGLMRLKDKVKVLHSNLGRDRCMMGGAHYVADKFFAEDELYDDK